MGMGTSTSMRSTKRDVSQISIGLEWIFQAKTTTLFIAGDAPITKEPGQVVDGCMHSEILIIYPNPKNQ